MAQVGTTTGSSLNSSGANKANAVQATYVMPADGWVTKVSAKMGGKVSNPFTQLALWTSTGQVTWQSGAFQPGVGSTVQQQTAPNIPIPNGVSFAVGFWRQPAKDASWSYNSSLGVNQLVSDEPNTTAAGTFTNPYTSGAGALVAFCDYTANLTPNAGVWQAPTPSGTIADTDPTFSGTTPQAPGDAALDSVSNVTWTVYTTSDGAVLATVTFPVNAQISSWSYQLSDFGVALTSGIQYGTYFTYTDFFGQSSPQNTANTFTISTGPDGPSAPFVPAAGKLNILTGLVYQAKYTHPTPLSSNAVQVQVFNGPTSAPVFDSGTLTQTVANNGTISVPQWHNDLSPGTTYYWWVRARDTANVWGEWSIMTQFNTDNAPDPPILLSPSNGQVITT